MNLFFLTMASRISHL